MTTIMRSDNPVKHHFQRKDVLIKQIQKTKQYCTVSIPLDQQKMKILELKSNRNH